MSEAPQFADLERALTQVVRRLSLLRPDFPPGLLPAGMDKAGYIALARLVETGSVRLSDLAAALLLDVSTVSRQVRALEDGGLIERTADPDDRRASRLAATDRGRQVVSIVRAARHELLADVLADWPAGDVEAFAGLLGRFGASLPGLEAAASPTASPTPGGPAAPASSPRAGQFKEMASR
ncbi:MAG: MarR family transcriptional regulator [Actinomycetota bacterium]|nr:MarR family transcriptional regulator [Actinomycetota bacterium]